jgi:uncharacterized protein (DUF983 family)
VGDGPAVLVLVGVGNVPVTVAAGVAVIVSVGPKFALFKIIGRFVLKRVWAEDATKGTIINPMISKKTRMKTDTLAVALEYLPHPTRSLFIYIAINL